jgi:hypothetical protein
MERTCRLAAIALAAVTIIVATQQADQIVGAELLVLQLYRPLAQRGARGERIELAEAAARCAAVGADLLIELDHCIAKKDPTSQVALVVARKIGSHGQCILEW